MHWESAEMDIDSGFFVQQGDAWQPETASRYNAVNEMLGFLGSSGGNSYEQLQTISPETVRGLNRSDAMIPAGSCVTFFSPEWGNESLFSDTYVIKPGVTDPCGVTLKDCPPGEAVDVQISGLVPVRKTAALPPGVMIMPGDHFGDTKIVNINSQGNDWYRNYFKVSAVEFREDGRISKVRIYDGGNPSNWHAGITDIGEVSQSELEYDFAPGDKIYLRLIFIEPDLVPNYFSHKFEVNIIEKSDEPTICLAEISPDNTVIQRWTGGPVYWRERFVVPITRRLT